MVEKVALIEAVVDVYPDSTKNKVLWKNISKDEKALKDLAGKKNKLLRPNLNEPLRVFLLGNLYNTKFSKISSGGMQQSKRYFDILKYAAKDASDLAQQLIDQTWE